MSYSGMYAPRASRPELFRGTFSWDMETLHDDFKYYEPNFVLQDPRTWPLITMPVICTCPKPQYKTPLPWGAAYDAYFIECSMDWGEVTFFNEPLRLVVEPERKLARRFLYYPYNFAWDGAPRDYVGIPAEEYQLWMTAVNGHGWNKGEQQAGARALENRAKGPKPRIVTSHLEDPVISGLKKEMAMIQRMDTMEYELYKANIHGHQEFLRAEAAEKEVHRLQVAYKRERDNLVTEKKTTWRLTRAVRHLKKIGPSDQVEAELEHTKYELVFVKREIARIKLKLASVMHLVKGTKLSIKELIHGENAIPELDWDSE